MWKHLPRTILAAAIFVTTVVDVSTATDAGPVVTPPAVDLVDMPPEFAAAATWSTELFAQAELVLPPLRYMFHGDDTEPCSGRPGMHHPVDGVNVIEICTSEMSNAMQGTILHETAHAWLDHTLTDQRKAAFQRLRGWTYWRDYDRAAWHENGTEQAAEIMVWGLIDRPLAMIRINQHSCDELDAGYRTLTGQAPLHGFRDEC
ncbi:MAG: hypothetical protein ABWZ99_15655 [Ilumatobacteraceae bacterium]